MTPYRRCAVRQVRIQRRRTDRAERTARRVADSSKCTECAHEGHHDKPATHGQLCLKHFRVVLTRAAKHV
jgi:hypothetical protein